MPPSLSRAPLFYVNGAKFRDLLKFVVASVVSTAFFRTIIDDKINACSFVHLILLKNIKEDLKT